MESHMGFIQDNDVVKLLDDEDLIGEIGQALLQDPDAVSDLAGDIADALSDRLSDDPVARGQIVATAIASDEFKREVVKKLTADLS